MKRKYLIADLIIKISGADDAYMEKTIKPYMCQTLKKSDIVIRTSKTENFIENKFENIKPLGDSQYFYEGTDYDSLIFYDEKIQRIIALIRFDKSYSEVDITVCNLNRLCGINCNKLMYNVVGIAMHYIIRMKNGFVLHSSAIAVNGVGIAFSADSGVGKSTHTSMWLEHVADAKIINDDTPVLRVTEAGVYIYGSPWAGTSGLNSNLRVPLNAVVFLEQHEQNSINEISSTEAVKLFIAGVRSSVTAAMYHETLDTLDVIMNKVKMYYLRCNTDIEAMYTVKNKLM